jgi:hypothetical protein
MKTETVVALSFIIGGLAGIGVMTWVVFYPPQSWRDDDRFEIFPNTCMVSDLGTSFQVYCPK